jgi:N12 class adenine-specific DNA methylase
VSSTITHPIEDQLGFFGFTPDGSLVVTIQEDDGGAGRKEVVKVGFPDFRFSPDDADPESGPVARARANLAAIRLLRQLSTEGRLATREEQQVLARYIGWGPFPGVFVPEHPEWGRIGAELRELMTAEEWRAAEASTPNANHTPGTIIRFVYRVLERLGIDGPTWDGLQVLESSAGSGAFIGYGPAPESGARWTGVELEPVAGAVAQALYPSADIRIGGFEHAILPRNSFDLAVGNVPFGAYPVHDPVFNPRLFSIHNYFIAKCIALTRPGGLVALITSRYTMDHIDSQVRAFLGERADLVAAIRLPDSAFRGRAVQRVTTDLIILRRRDADEPAGGAAWLETVEVETQDGPARVNEYYAARPEMMAGHLRLAGRNQFRTGDPAVVLAEDQTLDGELERVLALVPEDVYRSRRSSGAIDFRDASEAADLADGAYKVVRGRLRRWMSARWVYHGLKHERDVYKVVSLCAVRDAQREVLRSQAQERPEEEQEAARRELNRVYDLFVRQYGPINLEKRVTDAAGKASVRRPNLDVFRGDPYAMNVAALEQYDADKSTVRKAAIFHQRVVRPSLAREHADTAEDALLLALDRCAHVHLPTIARLWGRPEDEVIDALEGRIFLNPATECWETDDDYLSGPVRRKLREAREAAKTDPRFAFNVQALELVQPEDVGPADIHVAFGATWIDRGIVLQFIRELLELRDEAKVEIAHVHKEALWGIRAPRHVRHSIRARQVWGTPRAGAVRLIEDLLNQRATVIYDTLKDAESGEEKTVRNPEATVAAQEKAQEIADEFSRWVWRDADRADYLVRRYNETFNDVRPRVYDGSHLTFPGLSTAFVPEKHQRNVVWQILSRGSTGVAHVVGAGKTLVAILASMRLRQLGLSNKPLHATMGHMLEQYSREFLQAYPQARLLTAHVDDVSSRDKRRLFFARAASDEYDAIIVTHAAFERLGMSETYEREYLEAEVAEFRELRIAAAEEEGERSLTVKQLQVIIRQYEARLAVLANRQGKDTNLTFEELGVDQLFVDEVHLFKNAATRTKIAGIPRAAKPSRRAADLMMKCEYLNELRGQHGVVTMTGTLISNTISEAHVHLRFLAPKLLRAYGIEHFDAFAANFIERRWELEVSPDGGGFRVRERFHFCNVPELHSVLSQVVDIQLAESLYEPAEEEPQAEDTGGVPALTVPPSMGQDGAWAKLRIPQRGAKKLLKLPRPRVLGGRPETITAPPSKALLRYTAKLVDRAERIRMGGVNPRIDNMLAVTNDGRNAALDMRLINPALPDDPQSKVNLLVAKVHDIWLASAEQRGVQLIFCDLSTPRTDGRFSVYDDIRRKLIGLGVPAHEIAFMQDATEPRKKAALQAQVRAGKIRILLGSTSTMGTGTHFPDLIVAMHHLDAPYRPSDIEQRDGRGARRGNRNPFIAIYRYVTERSFDAYIWNLLHYKLQMINRVMLGDPSIRKLADNDAVTLNYAEVKALATGNPLILEKAKLDAEVARLSRARAAFIDRQFRLRSERADFPRRLAAAEAVLASARTDLATRQDTTGDAFRIAIGDVEYTTRTEGGIALKRAIEEACYAAAERQVVRIGRFAGFELLASVHPKMQMISGILRGARDYEGDLELFQAPASLAQALERIPRKLEGIIQSYEHSVAYLHAQVAQLQSIADEPFAHEAKLSAMVARQREIERELRLDGGGQVRQDLGALATAEEIPDVGGDEEEELPVAA